VHEDVRVLHVVDVDAEVLDMAEGVVLAGQRELDDGQDMGDVVVEDELGAVDAEDAVAASEIR
jgi:hypothetical protein